MSLLKKNRTSGSNTRNYFLYAIGESFLIVFGILLALYINNQNSTRQYQKKIDNNFARVFDELEKNITNTRLIIERLYVKDSLIYLVMNDSVSAIDYQNNFDLAYLIINYHNSSPEDKAYQNLIALNTSENSYQDSLISSLKELYGYKSYIKEVNDRMLSFVYEVSLPALAENISSFGDLTYKSQIKPDAISYFVNAETYKSYVSQYAIIAIKNQLNLHQDFLKEAQDVHSHIQETYQLETNLKSYLEPDLVQPLLGSYQAAQIRDTMSVKFENDSLYLLLSSQRKLNLIPISENLYFTDNEGGGYFISFVERQKKRALKINILPISFTYQKLNE